MIARPVNPFPVAPEYKDVYSHAVEYGSGRVVTISGQVGVAPDGTLATDFEGQCRQAMANVIAVLAAADMTVSNVVRLGFFLVQREHAAPLAALRREFFPDARPAVTNVIVAGLIRPDWLIEIEATAVAE